MIRKSFLHQKLAAKPVTQIDKHVMYIQLAITSKQFEQQMVDIWLENDGPNNKAEIFGTEK